MRDGIVGTLSGGARLQDTSTPRGARRLREAGRRAGMMLGLPGCPRYSIIALALLPFASLLGLPMGASAGQQPALGLPVDCDLGRDCFVQQMPDVDPGPGVLDPLCGKATYDGHDGWDIRLRSLADIDRNIAVVAVAEGRVLRVREGIPDHLFDRRDKGAALAGRECGNGVVVAHEGGLVSQYCHLKRGSVVARPGMQVRKGDLLGYVGASGLAEFPHVHLTIRRNSLKIEPLTGQPLQAPAKTCGTFSETAFSPDVRDRLAATRTAILGVGLAGNPPDLAELTLTGRIPPPQADAAATVAWGWAINVEAGERFRIRITRPGGAVLTDRTTDALPARKATYLAFAGRRRPAEAGSYAITVEILRDGQTLLERSTTVNVALPEPPSTATACPQAGDGAQHDPGRLSAGERDHDLTSCNPCRCRGTRSATTRHGGIFRSRTRRGTLRASETSRIRGRRSPCPSTLHSMSSVC